MRNILWEPWKLRVPCLLAFGILAAVMVFGCSQSSEEGGGDQTSKGQTAVTRGGTTAQATTQATTMEATTGKATTVEETTNRQENDAQQQNNGQQQENAARENQGGQDRGGGQIEITMGGQPGQQNQPGQQQGQPQQTATVRIVGTEGLSFSGRVGSAQELRRVEGTVPEEHEIPFGGVAVTAAIRKQGSGQGTVRVEVVRDGRVVASQKTSSATGVVNLVWRPQ